MTRAQRAFAICTMGVVSILAAHEARASYRSFAASECKATTYDSSGNLLENSELSWLSQSSDNDAAASVVDNVNQGYSFRMLCSATDDTTVSTTAGTVALTAYGYRSSSGSVCCDPPTCNDYSYLTIQTCRAYYGGFGGTCGAAASPAAGHLFAASVQTNGWTSGSPSPWDGYYVYTYLGCAVAGDTDNQLFSYYITN